MPLKCWAELDKYRDHMKKCGIKNIMTAVVACQLALLHAKALVMRYAK